MLGRNLSRALLRRSLTKPCLRPAQSQKSSWFNEIFNPTFTMSSQFTFEAIGTHWVIDIWQDISKADEEKILREIGERIDMFDKAYSRFRADSLVTKMSEKSGDFILPDDAEKMMSLYYDMFLLTDGLVTPLVGQVL